MPADCSTRLTAAHRRWTYAIFASLAGSGALWLVARYVLQAPDDAPNPLAVWLMRIHGAIAMLALMLIGTLVTAHVLPALRRRCNRWTGASLIAAVVVLTLTGYALFYAGNEWARSLASITHWVIGLVAVPALALHIWIGRRARR